MSNLRTRSSFCVSLSRIAADDITRWHEGGVAAGALGQVLVGARPRR